MRTALPAFAALAALVRSTSSAVAAPPRPFALEDLTGTSFAGAGVTLGTIEAEDETQQQIIALEVVGQLELVPHLDAFLRWPLVRRSANKSMVDAPSSHITVAPLTLGLRHRMLGTSEWSAAFTASASFPPPTGGQASFDLHAASGLVEDERRIVPLATGRAAADLGYDAGAHFVQVHVDLSLASDLYKLELALRLASSVGTRLGDNLAMMAELSTLIV
jgi:hypothetical protein